MKNKIIIGIGVVGLICSLVAGYAYWVILRVAVLLAGSQGDNSLNIKGWLWFGTLCVGVALLLISAILFFINRRRKNALSAA